MLIALVWRSVGIPSAARRNTPRIAGDVRAHRDLPSNFLIALP
jgi:hypothetical protein